MRTGSGRWAWLGGLVALGVTGVAAGWGGRLGPRPSGAWLLDRGCQELLLLGPEALVRGTLGLPCPVRASPMGTHLACLVAEEGRGDGTHRLWWLGGPGHGGSSLPWRARSGPAHAGALLDLEPDGSGGLWLLGSGGLLLWGTPGGSWWATRVDPEARWLAPAQVPGPLRLLVATRRRLLGLDGTGRERVVSVELPGAPRDPVPRGDGGWWVACERGGGGVLLALDGALRRVLEVPLDRPPGHLAPGPHRLGPGAVTVAPYEGASLELFDGRGRGRGVWTLDGGPVEDLRWLDLPQGQELWVAIPGALLRLDDRGDERPGQGGFGHLVGIIPAGADRGARR